MLVSVNRLEGPYLIRLDGIGNPTGKRSAAEELKRTAGLPLNWKTGIALQILPIIAWSAKIQLLKFLRVFTLFETQTRINLHF
ncbi:hypothetical protein [Pedobacter sp.]|uniref:hypothetical protein n=1 Tax=Pedobacter sp. TaxID=1411316 RepID=UPI0031D8BE6D